MSEPGAYERFVRPILFSLDPETAHHLALGCLRLASNCSPLLKALSECQPRAEPTKVFGVNFPNPIGLAAGFDKNGIALPAWEALGFGFVEIGTVTAKAQSGNPKPRIFRFPEKEALVNRLGFNNDGADVVAERLRRLRTSGRWSAIPVGINIGKSKVTPLEDAAEDYLYTFERLRDFADYIVLNVSSPNTPGLRALQEEEALAHLLQRIQKANRESKKTILLKIAPDLSEAELDKIIATCEQHEIAGIVATNTTLDHSALPAALDQIGGLSGAPLRERSTAFIRAIKQRTRLPIIGVGGIMNAEDAREKFEAGASLVQVYTGYIYRGPGLLREIADER